MIGCMTGNINETFYQLLGRWILGEQNRFASSSFLNDLRENTGGIFFHEELDLFKYNTDIGTTKTTAVAHNSICLNISTCSE